MAIDAGTLEIKMMMGIARITEDIEKVKNIVGGGMKNIESAVASAKAALGALGIGLGVGYFVSLIKGSIDAMDHLNDLSKSTNIAVGELAGLKLLAQMSGTDLDGMAKGINKMSVAIGASPEQFKALGVTAKDSIGQFKQLADIFNSLHDVNQRNALAMKVFGKSWAELAPALSEGSAKIGEIIAKGKALSGVTDEMAKQADEFNDNLKILSATSEGLRNKMVGDMLPGLVDITKAMQEAAERGGPLLALWVGLGGAMSELLGMGKGPSTIKQMESQIFELSEKTLPLLRERMANAIQFQPQDVKAWQNEIDKFEAQIKALQMAIRATGGEFEDQVSRAAKARTTKMQPAIIPDADAKAAKFLQSDKLTAEMKLYQGEAQRLTLELQKLTGQTEAQRLQYELTIGTLKTLSPEHKNLLRDLGAQVDARRALEVAAKSWAAAVEEATERQNKAGEALRNFHVTSRERISDIQFEIELLGKSADAQRLATDLRALDIKYRASLAGLDDAALANAAKLYDLNRKGLIEASGALAGATKLKNVPMEMAAAWTKAGTIISDSLTKAFGAGGAAAAGMVRAVSDGMAKQIAIEEDYKVKRTAVGADLQDLAAKESQDRAQNTLSMYGDMAGAAASYFDKQSKGYKILHAIEQVMFAAKMAMAVATISSNVAVGLSGVASSGIQGAADSALLLVKIALGIANQANGEPYSAWARMAAMAAVMVGVAAIAGVAFSFGGGGGGAHVAGSVAMQAAQGTGTVFGDSAAKSASIANALEILRDNSSSDLLYTSRMLTALLNIESSMSGMAAAVVRSQLTGAGVKLPGSGGGNAFSLDNAGIILGRATTPGSSEPDQGYSGQTVAQLISGAIVTGFTDIARAHTGTFSGSSYTAVNREQHLLSPEDALVEAIGRTVKGIAGAIGEAVEVLTHGAMTIEQVNTLLADLPIEAMSISFADLKGDALVEALQSVFSALGDTMVTSILTPAGIQVLEEFQQVGEGAFETIIRVASGVELAQATLDQWGITMIDWQDIANKQGDVTTELIRDSIVLSQTQDDVTSSIGLLIKGFDGSADDIISFYKTLLKLGVLFRGTGLDVNLLTQTLITAAGGLESLTSGLEAYQSGFFTVEEIAAAKTSELTTAFKNLGLELPSTRAALRAMIEAAKAAGDDKLLGALLKLVPAFADLVPAITDAAGAAATGGAAPAGGYYGAFGEPFYKPGPEYWEAQAAAAALAKALDQARLSVGDWLHGLMLNESLSPLTPEARLNFAHDAYVENLLKAQGNDVDALSKYTQFADEYLKELRSMFGSGSEYLQGFAGVTDQAKGLAGLADASRPVTAADSKAATQAIIDALGKLQAEVARANDEMPGHLSGVTKPLQVLEQAVRDGASVF